MPVLVLSLVLAKYKNIGAKANKNIEKNTTECQNSTLRVFY